MRARRRGPGSRQGCAGRQAGRQAAACASADVGGAMQAAAGRRASAGNDPCGMCMAGSGRAPRCPAPAPLAHPLPQCADAPRAQMLACRVVDRAHQDHDDGELTSNGQLRGRATPSPRSAPLSTSPQRALPAVHSAALTCGRASGTQRARRGTAPADKQARGEGGRQRKGQRLAPHTGACSVRMPSPRTCSGTEALYGP